MSIDLLKQALLDKQAEMMGTNEQSTKGTMDLYPDPEGRGAPGTIDAPWGEPGDIKGQGTAVEEANSASRMELLRKSFESFTASAKADKNLINSNFTDAALRTRESHSPLLQKEASPTLSEQVKKVLRF